MAKPASKEKPGCAKKMLLGMGCGCIYPLIILIFLGGISWFYLANAFSNLTKPVVLPDFSGPAQENFWTLQEKRLALEESSKKSLALSPSEFNALLSSVSFPPKNGFCLQKLRFIPGEKKGTLYIIGSGFLMRSLVFTLFVTTNPAGKPIVSKIMINSWVVPENGIFRTKAIEYLHSIFSPSVLPELNLLSVGKASISFSTATVTLSTSIIEKRP